MADETVYYPNMTGGLTQIDPAVAQMMTQAVQAALSYGVQRAELRRSMEKIEMEFQTFANGQSRDAAQHDRAYNALMSLIELAGRHPQVPAFLDAATAAFNKFMDGTPDFQQKAIDFLSDRYKSSR